MTKKIGFKKLIFLVFVVFGLIGSRSSYLLAQNEATPQNGQPDKAVQQQTVFEFQDSEHMPEPNLKQLVFRVFVMLGIILICIVGLIYVLKLFIGNKKALFAKNDKYVQLIDRLNIESKKSVYLIKVLDEVLVVGSGADSFTLLSKITDTDKVEALSSKEFKPLLNLFSQNITGNKGITNEKNESR